MNIVIAFIGGFPPAIARLAEYNYEIVRSMVRYLNKQGARVYIISNKPDLYSESAMVSDGLPDEVVVLRNWSRYTTLITIPLQLIKIRKRARCLILSYYHGIFGGNPIIDFLTTLLVLVLSKILAFRVITILHTVPELRKTSLREVFGSLWNLYYIGLRIVTLTVLSLSSKVIILVNVYKNALCNNDNRKLCQKIVYVHHGVPNYLSNTHGVSVNEEIMRRNGSGNRINIAFIGLLSSRKRFNIIIDTVSKLRDKSKREIRLFIIGTAHPYQVNESISMLKRLVNTIKNVTYVGYLPIRELQEYVERNIDIVFLPYSFPTGTSGIANFIAPTGKPLIMPAFAEYAEIALQGYGIKLYDPRDKEVASKIADIILNVILNNAEYGRLSERTIKYSKKYRVELSAVSILRYVLEELRE